MNSKYLPVICAATLSIVLVTIFNMPTTKQQKHTEIPNIFAATEEFDVNPELHSNRDIRFAPIGYFHTQWTTKTGAPRQGVLKPNIKAIIKIDEPYRDALADLEKFDRVIVLYHFNITKKWSATVNPPGSSHQFGLFATRSPKRPNPIGFSVVTLDSIDREKGILYLKGVDAFEGTPVLDIKPYLPSIDSLESKKNTATEKELGHHDELMITEPAMYN